MSKRNGRAPGSPYQPYTVAHAREWTSGLILDSGEPWVVEPFQMRLMADLFAGYPEVWLIIPEANAKTTLSGGYALYHAENTPHAMVTVAAASRDQALWLYLAADGFVARSNLRGFRCQEGYRRIRYDKGGSRIQVYAADDRTGDGAQPTLAILDELHRHRDLRLYRTWRGKLAKRGGQLLAISTAGEPGSEFENVRARMKEQATKITTRGGWTRAVGEGYVLHEYALPEGRSPDNMRDVKMANPLKAITPEILRAKYDSPAMTRGHWMRFSCGRPASMDAETPITPEQWDALRVDIGGVADGDQVWVAVRVGQAGGCSIGIAAVREGSAAVRCEVYPYSFPGLEQALKRLMARYDVRMIYVDERQHGIGTDVLEAAGLPLENEPQSPIRLMEATATFLGLMSAGTLMHDGDEVLRKQVLMARMKETTTGAYFEPSGETQALIAVVMAVHEAIKHAKDRPPRIHVYRGA